MKKNIREYIELSAYNRAVDHLKDRGITALIREDKKIVVEQQDYERAVRTLDKAYTWGELTLQPKVTTLKEHYDLDSIVKRFPKEIKDWRHNGDMSDDLFHALYDYYFDEMPYGTKKARDGDPYEWVSNRLDQDLGHDVEESTVPVMDEGNGAHMFVMGDTVYFDNKEGRVDRQEGNKVFVHTGNGQMDVWPADETSLTRQGAIPTMRKHINQVSRGLKGFFTGRPELEEADEDDMEMGHDDSDDMIEDLEGSLENALEDIKDGAEQGHDMIDNLADELNSLFDAIEQSENQKLKNAYHYAMDNGQEAEGDPRLMAKIMATAINMLGKKSLGEKAKNPYAVGMAQAMKSTGDEPPLKKSTIKKAHEIARKVDEADVEEGNEFSGALAKAKAEGKDEFEVDGKKYKVNETSSLLDIKRLAGLK